MSISFESIRGNTNTSSHEHEGELGENPQATDVTLVSPPSQEKREEENNLEDEKDIRILPLLTHYRGTQQCEAHGSTAIAHKFLIDPQHTDAPTEHNEGSISDNEESQDSQTQYEQELRQQPHSGPSESNCEDSSGEAPLTLDLSNILCLEKPHSSQLSTVEENKSSPTTDCANRDNIKGESHHHQGPEALLTASQQEPHKVQNAQSAFAHAKDGEIHADRDNHNGNATSSDERSRNHVISISTRKKHQHREISDIFALYAPPSPGKYPRTSPKTHRTTTPASWNPMLLCARRDSANYHSSNFRQLNEALPPHAPKADHVALTIAVQCIEILNGHRPLWHLKSWLDPQVYEILRRRTSLAMTILGKQPRRRAPRARCLSIKFTQPRAVELVVVVDDEHHHTLAIRLEYHKRTWIVSALEMV